MTTQPAVTPLPPEATEAVRKVVLAAVSDCLVDFEREVATYGTVRAVPLHLALQSMADDVAEVVAPVVREAAFRQMYQDVCGLVADYGDPDRDIIAAMPFGASLDQLMVEGYGVADLIDEGEK